MAINKPNYHKIYSDIIYHKYPQKKLICQSILEKKELFVLDILKLNHLIFGMSSRENVIFNQRHRSYSMSDILEILDYQKKNNLNNSQLANHFKLSRNTITKWKKHF